MAIGTTTVITVDILDSFTVLPRAQQYLTNSTVRESFDVDALGLMITHPTLRHSHLRIHYHNVR